MLNSKLGASKKILWCLKFLIYFQLLAVWSLTNYYLGLCRSIDEGVENRLSIIYSVFLKLEAVLTVKNFIVKISNTCSNKLESDSNAAFDKYYTNSKQMFD